MFLTFSPLLVFGFSWSRAMSKLVVNVAVFSKAKFSFSFNNASLLCCLCRCSFALAKLCVALYTDVASFSSPLHCEKCFPLLHIHKILMYKMQFSKILGQSSN